MDIVKRQIVRAKAGHDRGLYFVVIDFDDVYVYLVNGKSRPLEKPKKKKIMHIAITKTVVPQEMIQTDKKIRRVISDYAQKTHENHVG